MKHTVLVGHNLFLDLVYFYSTFFGPLPDRVGDFQHIIAGLFPLIFDTKYLADTINNNSPLYKSSLEELDHELSKLPVPVIGRLPQRKLKSMPDNANFHVQRHHLSTASTFQIPQPTKQDSTAS